MIQMYRYGRKNGKTFFMNHTYPSLKEQLQEIAKKMYYDRQEHVTRHPLSNPKKMREFLSQTRYWVDASLSKVRIKDMDSDYLFATMLFLIKRAAQVHFSFEMYYVLKGADMEKIDELRGLSPEKFIRQTPLFSKMQSRYLQLNSEDELVIPSVVDDVEEIDGSTY